MNLIKKNENNEENQNNESKDSNEDNKINENNGEKNTSQDDWSIHLLEGGVAVLKSLFGDDSDE